MSMIAVAIGGMAIGGVGSYLAANQAANAQTDAANQANATQKYMFDTQQQNIQPWLQAGQGALGQLSNQNNPQFANYGNFSFQDDPGYKFTLDQGTQAIQRSAAARGMLNSPATEKALAQYTTGLANQTYNDAFNRYNTNRMFNYNRLAGLAGIGQQASGQINQAAQNYGTNVSNNQIGAGNAQAAGYVGGANAINNAIGQGTNTWMQYQLMNRLAPEV